MRSDLSLGPVTAHAINAVLLPNDVSGRLSRSRLGSSKPLSSLVFGWAAV